jgi:hypothetical protein
VIVCVILFPFWFLFGKPHYEESGYDKWNIFFTNWMMILT